MATVEKKRRLRETADIDAASDAGHGRLSEASAESAAASESTGGVAPPIDDVSVLVKQVADLLAKGTPQAAAIQSIRKDTERTAELDAKLWDSGLGSFVDGYRARQNSGEVATGGVRFRTSSQVAPGKKSEWDEYTVRYPRLAGVTYIGDGGKLLSLLSFSAVDWRSARDRDDTRKRKAAARVLVADKALRLLKDRKVERTRDLPAEDLASLEASVKEAWQR